MGKNDLHRLAEQDTPSVVNVPETWHGLLMWAVGRFGGGIVIALVAGLAAQRVYEDHSALTKQVIEAYRQQAEVQAKNAAAIDALTKAVDALSKEAQISHRIPAGSARFDTSPER